MQNLIPARDLQKSYKKIINNVVETNQPAILMSRNKAQAAIISMNLLHLLNKIIAPTHEGDLVVKTDDGKIVLEVKTHKVPMDLKALEQEAREAIKKGEVEVIDTQEKLDQHFKEIDEYVTG